VNEGRRHAHQFFHAHANARRRRNFIRSVTQDGEVLVSKDRKVEAFFSFYDELLGAPAGTRTINLDVLDIPRLDLSHLGQRFMKEEVWAVIRALPADKAPAPTVSPQASFNRHGR
jgi:hypothetical protein